MKGNPGNGSARPAPINSERMKNEIFKQPQDDWRANGPGNRFKWSNHIVNNKYFLTGLLRLGMLFAAFLLVSAEALAIERQFTVANSVIDGLRGQIPQIVIVEYASSSIQAEAAKLRTAEFSDIDPPSAIELKATRYRSLKRSVLSQLDTTDIEVHTDYSHLPMTAMWVKSLPALQRLIARPEIVAIYEDILHYPNLTESLPVIGQPPAESRGYTGVGTTVVVIDQGVDYTNEAFGSCSAPGAGCSVVAIQPACTGSWKADNHGTNVAGIVLGVAPAAKIASLDVFCGNGTATATAILEAINWAMVYKTTYNIVAMNLSLGSGIYSTYNCPSYATRAFAEALAAGIAPIVAAGNDANSHGINGPACVAGAISVGATYDADVGPNTYLNRDGSFKCSDATTHVDQVTCFSNSDSLLTLLAPGARITAAEITMNGTSQAAPHVAGAWALLKQRNPQLSMADGVAALVATGTPIRDSRNGLVKPRIQISDALNAIPGVVTLGVNSNGTSSVAISAAPSTFSGTTNYQKTATLDFGTVITLTAPNNTTDSVFAGWVGCDSVSGPVCTVTMNQSKSVTANFMPIAALLMLFNLEDDEIVAPGPPTNVTATAGSGSVTLRFSPPADTGGSPITHYTATCAATGEATRTATGTSSPLTVTNLTGGKAYQCTVASTNAANLTGTASVAVTVTPGPKKKNGIAAFLMLLLD
jgi:subtilisin family serine protease